MRISPVVSYQNTVKNNYVAKNNLNFKGQQYPEGDDFIASEREYAQKNSAQQIPDLSKGFVDFGPSKLTVLYGPNGEIAIDCLQAARKRVEFFMSLGDPEVDFKRPNVKDLEAVNDYANNIDKLAWKLAQRDWLFDKNKGCYVRKDDETGEIAMEIYCDKNNYVRSVRKYNNDGSYDKITKSHNSYDTFLYMGCADTKTGIPTYDKCYQIHPSCKATPIKQKPAQKIAVSMLQLANEIKDKTEPTRLGKAPSNITVSTYTEERHWGSDLREKTYILRDELTGKPILRAVYSENKGQFIEIQGEDEHGYTLLLDKIYYNYSDENIITNGSYRMTLAEPKSFFNKNLVTREYSVRFGKIDEVN